jgi:hypothetical protein
MARSLMAQMVLNYMITDEEVESEAIKSTLRGSGLMAWYSTAAAARAGGHGGWGGG